MSATRLSEFARTELERDFLLAFQSTFTNTQLIVASIENLATEERRQKISNGILEIHSTGSTQTRRELVEDLLRKFRPDGSLSIFDPPDGVTFNSNDLRPHSIDALAPVLGLSQKEQLVFNAALFRARAIAIQNYIGKHPGANAIEIEDIIKKFESRIIDTNQMRLVDGGLTLNAKFNEGLNEEIQRRNNILNQAPTITVTDTSPTVQAPTIMVTDTSTGASAILTDTSTGPTVQADRPTKHYLEVRAAARVHEQPIEVAKTDPVPSAPQAPSQAAQDKAKLQAMINILEDVRSRLKPGTQNNVAIELIKYLEKSAASDSPPNMPEIHNMIATAFTQSIKANNQREGGVLSSINSLFSSKDFQLPAALVTLLRGTNASPNLPPQLQQNISHFTTSEKNRTRFNNYSIHLLSADPNFRTFRDKFINAGVVNDARIAELYLDPSKFDKNMVATLWPQLQKLGGASVDEGMAKMANYESSFHPGMVLGGKQQADPTIGAKLVAILQACSAIDNRRAELPRPTADVRAKL